jgi:OOP family OmpA-OmpF porin
VLAAACAGPVPAPKQAASTARLPDPGADQQYKVQFPDLGRGQARFIRLTLGEDLSKDCGLVKTYFEFDSSEPLPQDKLELKAFSECLADPSRKDLGLLLVGSADRRDSEEYNQELSERRAERVKEILVNAGISASRIAIASRGERRGGTARPRGRGPPGI